MGAGEQRGGLTPEQEEIRRQLEKEVGEPERSRMGEEARAAADAYARGETPGDGAGGPDGAPGGPEGEGGGDNPEDWPTEAMILDAQQVAAWIVNGDNELEPPWWMTYLLSHELGIPPWDLHLAPAEWVKIAWIKVQGFKLAREEAQRRQLEESRLHVVQSNPRPGDRPGGPKHG